MNKTLVTLSLLALLCALFATIVDASAEVNIQSNSPTKTTNILFGSCSHQAKPMPIFKAILQEPRDAFVFLGDNIYGDTEDMAQLKEKYTLLGNNPLFKKLRETTPVYAIWDDHDYGKNDAGKEYPFKQASKDIMLDFWQVPKSSPRWNRPDGIYGSYVVGEGAHKIRIILPDLRYSRDPIDSVGHLGYLASRQFKDMGPYNKSQGSMMAEAQWQWLEQELQKPEPIKIIGSSLQILADFTGWEAWNNFDDKNRLVQIIKKHQVNGVLIVSGDTHWGEISRLDEGVDYPLWDITSSGLTEEWKNASPNKQRVSATTSEVNYGFMSIDWQNDPIIHFGLKDVEGATVMENTITLTSISAY